MSDIKNSKILQDVLSRLKKIEPVTNFPLTAERFLLILVEDIKDLVNEGPEMAEAKRILEEHNIDLTKARIPLSTYITNSNDKLLSDNLYMNKKLYEAKVLAEKQGKTEISIELLLSCILADPSDSLKKILDEIIIRSDEPTKLDASDVISISASVVKRLSGLTEESSGKKPSRLTGWVEVNDTPDNNGFYDPKKIEIDNLVADAKRIRTELQSSIFGQDNAINVFVTGYFQSAMLSMTDKSRKRPRATFLFAGPPGVGKTFLAEKAAESLGLPFMRFDMSEYADKEANLEFCGSDKVYKNGKQGNVTGFVEENPRCVLLFDEIEKAHISVIHLFLQMLDAGRLRDNFTDTEVSFSDAIIILTTNAGKQLYEDSENGDFSGISRKVIVRALQKDVNPETKAPLFPAAICSRFASGNVVMFNHIEAHNLRGIAKKEIERHAANLEKETGIRFKIDERVYTALLFSEGSTVDARTIRSRAETFFNDEFYELLRMVSTDKVKTGIKDITTIKIGIELDPSKPDVYALFTSMDKPQALMLADDRNIRACAELLPDIEFVGVQSADKAFDAVKNQNISFIMLDVKFGMAASSTDKLNTEDIESPARDFFKLLKEQKNETPIYLVEESGALLNDEEKVSFVRQGIRGSLELTNDAVFASRLEAIAMSLHQQASMKKLAKENKLVSFETSQNVSADGKIAEIKLFDFELAVSVDSEDSKNVLSSVSTPKERFDDVIGANDAKEELKYFVEYLKNPKKYMGTGVKPPKGVILYGPPGTGKTMLAKAMACEAGVTFIAAEGNQFLKKYVGEGSEKVHELFKTARKYAPSILFIDEIDAIAKERKGNEGNSSSNGEETLTAFLTEMDGFISDPSKPVFVLAATNFDVEPGSPKSLDSALMRRFDRRVYIDLPDKEDRIRFLKMKIERNKALCISETQLDNIAMRSTGMSLAELDSVVELALRSAIRKESVIVDDAILEEAFETFNSGEVKKWDPSQLERVAIHESGHALLCWLGGETPSYLTIVARGSHGGYMQHASQEGKAIYTKNELLSRIRTSLGGRAAEIVYYGEQDGISTGASGDLTSATGLAQKLICAYGMDKDFGLAVVDGVSASNGTMSMEIKNAVNRILYDQMGEAIRLISDNRAKIDALVEEIMVKNHMNGAEIEAVLSR